VKTVQLRHEIDLDEDVFWNECMLVEAFNKRLFVEHLKFGKYVLLEQRDEGGKVVKRQELEPPLVGLPGPVKKVIGDRLSYLEEGVFDKASKVYSFKVIPSTMPDKTTVTGTMRTAALAPGRCLRTVDVTVEVKVFGIGGLVEDKIAGDLRGSYENTVAFLNEFGRTRKAP
jgi:hypothetical protein